MDTIHLLCPFKELDLSTQNKESCVKQSTMEGVSEERSEEKFVRKNSGKAFKSRKHDKAEKRKQRKKWLKKKRQRQQQQQQESPVQHQKSPVHDEPPVKEKWQVHEEKTKEKARKAESNVEHVSRGKRLVQLSKRKRKNDEEVTTRSKVAKPTKGEDHTKLAAAPQTTRTHNFKELDRDLLKIDETGKIGSGTFGRCFTAMYRNQYRVVVKEMKVRDSSKKETERAKQEVFHEASVLADLGDHPGIPHLFGVCSLRAPFYLVLEQLAVEGRSVTLSRAAATGLIADVAECTEILKQTCEVLMFIHQKGYLHNDLKGNNIVLDGTSHKATLIDFGKSKKIAKVKLTKPKVNVADATLKYPHIAPEIHRGERQSTASDVYSFGVLTLKVLKDGQFDNPALKSTAKRCLSSIPGKRPKLEEIF